MGIVAITGPVLAAVDKKVKEMHRKEQADVTPRYAEMHMFDNAIIDTELSELFMQKHWGEYRYLIKAMPDEWILPRDCARIIVVTPEGNHIAVDISSSFRCTPVTSYHRPKVEGVTSHALPERYHAAVAAYDAYTAATKALDAKYDQIRAQLRNFLRAHKTLNKALIAFPALAFYLDDNLKRRLEAKGERERIVQDPVSVEIDRGLITSTAVAAAIRGNG